MDIYELQAEFFKAMSHPLRMKILTVLKEKGTCVSDVVELAGETQPQVSRCLAALNKAGLVSHEKQGVKSCYRISSKEVFRLLDISKRIIKRQAEARAEAIKNKRR